MWLLAGLGNPGDKYAGNRHNVGFMALDAIADECSAPGFRSKFQSLMAEAKIDGQKVVLLKPQTMMNNSGEGVRAAAQFFKIPPERIIVFYDELDLPFGKLRVKCGGGAAGHNGIKSIKAHMGTDAFWRVRIGIDHPGDKSRVANYVLSDFSKAEQKALEPLLWAIGKHAHYLIENKDSEFMTRIAEA